MDWWTLTANKGTEGSIKNWVNHSVVPVETVITEAEALIFQRLRVISMLTLLEGSLSDGDQTIDISALRFLQPRSFYLTGDYQQKVTLRQQEVFELALAWDTDGTLAEGTPTDYMHNRSTIYLNREADATIPYRIWYYAKPVPLSESNVTNLLTTDYPHILREACLAVAYQFRKDSTRRGEALQALAAYIEMAQVDSDMANETAKYEMYWNEDHGSHAGW